MIMNVFVIRFQLSPVIYTESGREPGPEHIHAEGLVEGRKENFGSRIHNILKRVCKKYGCK